MLRPAVRPARPLLDRGHHPPDRPSPQTPGAEGQGLEEAVVELLPLARPGQFRHRLAGDLAGRSGQEQIDVLV